MKPLPPELFAWVVGLLIVALVSVIAFLFIGWLGIFLIGVLGMTVTSNMELNGNYTITTDVKISARRVEEFEKASASQKKMSAAEKAKQSRLVYILNTVWLAMIALGLAMFSAHQI